MDVRKADKQETVYGDKAKTIVPFPKIHKLKARLEGKGAKCSLKLYEKPAMIKGNLPAVHPTAAPPNKPWFCWPKSALFFQKPLLNTF